MASKKKIKKPRPRSKKTKILANKKKPTTSKLKIPQIGTASKKTQKPVPKALPSQTKPLEESKQAQKNTKQSKSKTSKTTASNTLLAESKTLEQNTKTKTTPKAVESKTKTTPEPIKASKTPSQKVSTATHPILKKNKVSNFQFLMIILIATITVVFVLLGILFGRFFYLKDNVSSKLVEAEMTIKKYEDDGFLDLQLEKKRVEELNQESKKTFSFNSFTKISQESTDLIKIIDDKASKANQKKLNQLEQQKDELNLEVTKNAQTPLPSMDSFKNTIAQANQTLAKKEQSFKKLDQAIQEVEKSTNLFTTELEEFQKDQLLSSMRQSLETAKELSDFFKNRGYTSEVSKLKTYTQEIALLEKNQEYNKYTYADLEGKYQQELLPILDQASQAKQKIDEEYKKRIDELVLQEKNMRERNGLGSGPVAPISRNKLIYINLSSQYMYVYDKDRLVKSSPVTTGKNGFATVTGEYSIYAKTRNRYLNSPFSRDPTNPHYYRVYVKYWMPFFQGYGIHDASWRNGSFGGQDYKYNGSHGCVNTPDAMVRFVWDFAEIGTPVYVSY